MPVRRCRPFDIKAKMPGLYRAGGFKTLQADKPLKTEQAGFAFWAEWE